MQGTRGHPHETSKLSNGFRKLGDLSSALCGQICRRCTTVQGMKLQSRKARKPREWWVLCEIGCHSRRATLHVDKPCAAGLLRRGLCNRLLITPGHHTSCACVRTHCRCVCRFQARPPRSTFGSLNALPVSKNTEPPQEAPGLVLDRLKWQKPL